MNSFGKKLTGVVAAVVIAGVLIGVYVGSWATAQPRPVTAAPAAGPASANLTLQTVAAIGPKVDPSHPSWVSYLVREGGKWVHSTVFRVPANSLVHVTIYQYDSPTGLRNPFFSQVQGTVGGVAMIDGKPVGSIPAEEASHTFAVPQLGVFVPLPGVPEEAKHPCEEAPCEASTSDHRTIEFTIRTGAKGKYRWQCFVPCGAGYQFGNGGPMQTYGYMHGVLEAV